MDPSSGYCKVVEKRVTQRVLHALTPLERFLSGSFRSTNLMHHAGYTGDDSSFSNGMDLLNTIRGSPNGILLNDLVLCGGLVCSGETSMPLSKEKELHPHTSSSTSSSSTAAAPVSMVKGQWTAEEDSLLIKLVKQHGVRKWSQIAKSLVGRIGKQCRERWHNHLRPDIKKEMWTEDEEKLLVEAHKKFGNKWAEIARRIPGRSENSIKNHWNATKRSQNAKRKSKKRADQGARSRSSILEDYIQSNTRDKTSTKNTNPSMILSTSSTHLDTAFKTPEVNKYCYNGGMQYDGAPNLLGFPCYGEEDDLLSGVDTSMLLASPEAPSLIFNEETEGHYDQVAYGCFNSTAQITERPNNCTLTSANGDMDLIEMISWQMSHTSHSQV